MKRKRLHLDSIDDARNPLVLFLCPASVILILFNLFLSPPPGIPKPEYLGGKSSAFKMPII